MTNRDQIIIFINNFLNISSYKDNSSNGLQIIGKNDVKKIALGVSYSLEFLEKSIELNCDIMIVHHGLFWGKIDRIDNSILKERIKKVFDHDLNLAAYHLPLDGNEEIGNNVSLCNELGFKFDKMFCDYEGKKIGTLCTNINNINFKDLKKIMKNKFDSEPIIFKNNENFKKIGIISGAAGSLVIDALKENCDTFITGETKEGSPALAKEAGINIIYMGHYNSEKIEIIKLGKILQKEFNIETEFIDIPNSI